MNTINNIMKLINLATNANNSRDVTNINEYQKRYQLSRESIKDFSTFYKTQIKDEEDIAFIVESFSYFSKAFEAKQTDDKFGKNAIDERLNKINEIMNNFLTVVNNTKNDFMRSYEFSTNNYDLVMDSLPSSQTDVYKTGEDNIRLTTGIFFNILKSSQAVNVPVKFLNDENDEVEVDLKVSSNFKRTIFTFTPVFETLVVKNMNLKKKDKTVERSVTVQQVFNAFMKKYTQPIYSSAFKEIDGDKITLNFTNVLKELGFDKDYINLSKISDNGEDVVMYSKILSFKKTGWEAFKKKRTAQDPSFANKSVVEIARAAATLTTNQMIPIDTIFSFSELTDQGDNEKIFVLVTVPDSVNLSQNQINELNTFKFNKFVLKRKNPIIKVDNKKQVFNLVSELNNFIENDELSLKLIEDNSYSIETREIDPMFFASIFKNYTTSTVSEGFYQIYSDDELIRSSTGDQSVQTVLKYNKFSVFSRNGEIFFQRKNIENKIYDYMLLYKGEILSTINYYTNNYFDPSSFIRNFLQRYETTTIILSGDKSVLIKHFTLTADNENGLDYLYQLDIDKAKQLFNNDIFYFSKNHGSVDVGFIEYPRLNFNLNNSNVKALSNEGVSFKPVDSVIENKASSNIFVKFFFDQSSNDEFNDWEDLLLSDEIIKNFFNQNDINNFQLIGTNGIDSYILSSDNETLNKIIDLVGSGVDTDHGKIMVSFKKYVLSVLYNKYSFKDVQKFLVMNKYNYDVIDDEVVFEANDFDAKKLLKEGIVIDDERFHVDLYNEPRSYEMTLDIKILGNVNTLNPEDFFTQFVSKEKVIDNYTPVLKEEKEMILRKVKGEDVLIPFDLYKPFPLDSYILDIVNYGIETETLTSGKEVKFFHYKVTYIIPSEYKFIGQDKHKFVYVVPKNAYNAAVKVSIEDKITSMSKRDYYRDEEIIVVQNTGVKFIEFDSIEKQVRDCNLLSLEDEPSKDQVFEMLMTYGSGDLNISYSGDSDVLFSKMSQSGNVCAVVYSTGVKIYKRMGVYFQYISTISHQGLSEIHMIGDNYIVTIQYNDNTIPFAVLWDINIDLPLLNIRYNNLVDGERVNVKDFKVDFKDIQLINENDLKNLKKQQEKYENSNRAINETADDIEKSNKNKKKIAELEKDLDEIKKGKKDKIQITTAIESVDGVLKILDDGNYLILKDDGTTIFKNKGDYIKSLNSKNNFTIMGNILVYETVTPIKVVYAIANEVEEKKVEEEKKKTFDKKKAKRTIQKKSEVTEEKSEEKKPIEKIEKIRFENKHSYVFYDVEKKQEVMNVPDEIASLFANNDKYFSYIPSNTDNNFTEDIKTVDINKKVVYTERISNQIYLSNGKFDNSLVYKPSALDDYNESVYKSVYPNEADYPVTVISNSIEWIFNIFIEITKIGDFYQTVIYDTIKDKYGMLTSDDKPKIDKFTFSIENDQPVVNNLYLSRGNRVDAVVLSSNVYEEFVVDVLNIEIPILNTVDETYYMYPMKNDKRSIHYKDGKTIIRFFTADKYKEFILKGYYTFSDYDLLSNSEYQAYLNRDISSSEVDIKRTVEDYVTASIDKENVNIPYKMILDDNDIRDDVTLFVLANGKKTAKKTQDMEEIDDKNEVIRRIEKGDVIDKEGNVIKTGNPDNIIVETIKRKYSDEYHGLLKYGEFNLYEFDIETFNSRMREQGYSLFSSNKDLSSSLKHVVSLIYRNENDQYLMYNFDKFFIENEDNLDELTKIEKIVNEEEVIVKKRKSLRKKMIFANEKQIEFEVSLDKEVKFIIFNSPSDVFNVVTGGSTMFISYVNDDSIKLTGTIDINENVGNYDVKLIGNYSEKVSSLILKGKKGQLQVDIEVENKSVIRNEKKEYNNINKQSSLFYTGKETGKVKHKAIEINDKLFDIIWSDGDFLKITDLSNKNIRYLSLVTENRGKLNHIKLKSVNEKGEFVFEVPNHIIPDRPFQNKSDIKNLLSIAPLISSERVVIERTGNYQEDYFDNFKNIVYSYYYPKLKNVINWDSFDAFYKELLDNSDDRVKNISKIVSSFRFIIERFIKRNKNNANASDVDKDADNFNDLERLNSTLRRLKIEDSNSFTNFYYDTRDKVKKMFDSIVDNDINQKNELEMDVKLLFDELNAYDELINYTIMNFVDKDKKERKKSLNDLDNRIKELSRFESKLKEYSVLKRFDTPLEIINIELKFESNDKSKSQYSMKWTGENLVLWFKTRNIHRTEFSVIMVYRIVDDKLEMFRKYILPFFEISHVSSDVKSLIICGLGQGFPGKTVRIGSIDFSRKSSVISSFNKENQVVSYQSDEEININSIDFYYNEISDDFVCSYVVGKTKPYSVVRLYGYGGNDVIKTYPFVIKSISSNTISKYFIINTDKGNMFLNCMGDVIYETQDEVSWNKIKDVKVIYKKDEVIEDDATQYYINKINKYIDAYFNKIDMRHYESLLQYMFGNIEIFLKKNTGDNKDLNENDKMIVRQGVYKFVRDFINKSEIQIESDENENDVEGNDNEFINSLKQVLDIWYRS